MNEKGEVYMLAQRVSKLETSQDHMANALERLATAVEKLTAAMNIRSGVDKAILWIAGGGGLMGAVALLKQLFK
ncbi:MAG: hypothetical protein EB059_09080 [Alphaproteobacteria bacterium]|nr:hypothetical protein [Alphaproteobacteria bacterium]